jgi:CubicO group peptidase (beta-lactamase class C family)
MEPGLDEGRLERVREVLARSVEEKAFPGDVWAVARCGKVAALEAFGQRDTDPEAPATVDTLYDMASVTKPVACATAAMLLLERGRLHTLEEARSFFPEFTLPHWAGIQVGHLLTHTSGLPDWTCTYADACGDAAVLSKIFAAEMKGAPGTRYEYSCLGYITLGKIVERVAGEPLDAFTKREVFEPLRMKSTGYRRISTIPKAGPQDDIAPTMGGDRDRGKLYGEVHDGNASALDGVSGNAGLFGTASDLLRYGQMLLNGGELEGARVLAPLTVRQMLKNQVDPAIGGHTWGFFCAPNGMHPSGELMKDGSAGHTGFTGTSLLVHPGLSLVAVLLTNRVLYDTAGHIRARRLFHNTLASAIVEG